MKQRPLDFPSDKPRVALLIETSGGYGRSVLRGIGRYARLHGPWSFYVLPRGHEQSLPDPSSWKVDGIIARIESRAVADRGHSIVFRDFDGRLLLCLHRYFHQPKTRVQLWELEDVGDRLKLGKQILGAP